MTVFEASGQDILNTLNESNAKKNEEQIDFKELYVNLKNGDSITICFLGTEDVKQYRSHGNFNLSLYNQTCTKRIGECAYCEAYEYAKQNNIAEWADIYAKNRFLFAVYDLSKEKIRIFNASKGQAKSLYGTINEYKEEIISDSMAFKFSRVGEKVETTYNLNPIIRLKDTELIKALEKSNEMKVTPETFEKALIIRSYQGQVKQLKELGFPNPEIFKTEEKQPETIDISDDKLPF